MRLNAKSRLFAIRINSMHELGIVVHISKTLEELAQENNITDIRRVTFVVLRAKCKNVANKMQKIGFKKDILNGF